MQLSALAALLLVGNSVSGTVSVIEPASLQTIGVVNVVPDLEDRLAEIRKNPLRNLVYELIKKAQHLDQFEPAGGDRFVDDVFASPDGSRMYVSRSNLGDVAAFDLATPGFPILWRTPIALFKADHAALSPDGSRIVVSASLADKAQVLETETGKIVGSFKTGHMPHQNDFSPDGRLIYNGSIGTLQLPRALNGLKGDRKLTVVDASTLKTVRTYSFDFGLRPTVVTPDGRTLFAQLSYLNGLVRMDLETGKIVQTSTQPFSAHAQTLYSKPDAYPHNSAHHGLSLSGDGQKLCDAGTIDDTVSIVSSSDLLVRATIATGSIPYWATTSEDGKICFVSLSGDNAVSVIDFETETEVARIPVGRFPQRSRIARLSGSALALLSTDARAAH